MTGGKPLNIEEILKDATLELKTSRASDTPRLDAEVMLAHILGCDRLNLILNAKKSVSDELRKRFSACLKRRLNEEPVSYILGYREFMSLKFLVSSGVLIPRPDTEILAEFAIEKANEIKNARVLDLCTGSGALAVSILKYAKSASAVAVDLSDICVKTAEENAKNCGVSDRISVIKQDILEDFDLNEKFDILVSNPPYIKTETIKSLDKTVKDFEPCSALDGGEDGLVFYRRIATISPRFIKNEGILAMEIGHDQEKEVFDILNGSGAFHDIKFHCDLAGIKRVISAKVGV